MKGHLPGILSFMSSDNGKKVVSFQELASGLVAVATDAVVSKVNSEARRKPT